MNDKLELKIEEVLILDYDTGDKVSIKEFKEHISKAEELGAERIYFGVGVDYVAIDFEKVTYETEEQKIKRLAKEKLSKEAVDAIHKKERKAQYEKLKEEFGDE